MMRRANEIGWIALLVVVAAAAVLIYWWLDRHSAGNSAGGAEEGAVVIPMERSSRLPMSHSVSAVGDDDSIKSPSAEISADSSSIVMEDRGSMVPRSPGVHRELEGVTTFHGLEESLADSPPGVRAVTLAKAAFACQDPAPPSPAKQLSGSEQYYSAYYKKFCASYSGQSQYEYLQDARFLPSNGELVQAEMLSEISDTPDGKKLATDAAQRMLLTTDQGAVLDAAGRYLLGDRDWMMGWTLADSSYERMNLKQAQGLALRMLSCRLSGGCGPDGWTTMLYCGPAGMCGAGVTAWDVWRQTHPRPIYDLATQIERELIERRATFR